MAVIAPRREAPPAPAAPPARGSGERPSARPAAASQRLLVILHGKRAADEHVRRAIAGLKDEGHTLTVRVTWDSGDVDAFVREAVELWGSQRYDALVAGGGDGTLNEVVAAMLKHGAPRELAVALLPLGTANDFACAAGISVVRAPRAARVTPALRRRAPAAAHAPRRRPRAQDPAEALRLALDPGTARPVDVALVNGQVFMNVAVAGSVAEVSPEELASRWKRLLGPAAIVLHAPAAAGGGGGGGGGADVQTLQADLLMLAAGNSRQMGRQMNVCPDALLDDGLLDFTLLTGGSMFAEVAALLGALAAPGGRRRRVRARCRAAARVVAARGGGQRRRRRADRHQPRRRAGARQHEVGARPPRARGGGLTQGCRLADSGRGAQPTRLLRPAPPARRLLFEVLPRALRMHLPDGRMLCAEGGAGATALGSAASLARAGSLRGNVAAGDEIRPAAAAAAGAPGGAPAPAPAGGKQPKAKPRRLRRSTLVRMVAGVAGPVGASPRRRARLASAGRAAVRALALVALGAALGRAAGARPRSRQPARRHDHDVAGPPAGAVDAAARAAGAWSFALPRGAGATARRRPVAPAAPAAAEAPKAAVHAGAPARRGAAGAAGAPLARLALLGAALAAAAAALGGAWLLAPALNEQPAPALPPVGTARDTVVGNATIKPALGIFPRGCKWRDVSVAGEPRVRYEFWHAGGAGGAAGSGNVTGGGGAWRARAPARVHARRPRRAGGRNLWYNAGRWYALVEGDRAVAPWRFSKNQEVAPLHVADAGAWAASVRWRAVPGDTLLFDYIFFVHPTAIGHWWEMMAPLYSVLKASRGAARGRGRGRGGGGDAPFARPADQVVLLHLQRTHLMEWVRAVMAVGLGVPRGGELPPILLQTAGDAVWQQLVMPLEGVAPDEWVVFDRALIVRDLFTGGGRSFTSTADARAFRAEVYQAYGLPPPGRRRRVPRVITFQRKAANRRVTNEAGLLALLARYGRVHVVEFNASTSFADQLATMAATGVFVSAHTSNLANAVFLQPGSAVVELIQRHWTWNRIDQSFRDHTTALGDVHHFAWRANRANESTYLSPRDAARFADWTTAECVTEDCTEASTRVDITVDLPALQALLDSRLPLVFAGASVIVPAAAAVPACAATAASSSPGRRRSRAGSCCCDGHGFSGGAGRSSGRAGSSSGTGSGVRRVSITGGAGADSSAAAAPRRAAAMTALPLPARELFINGRWVAPAQGRYLDVVSPATERVIGRVPAGSAEDVDAAVAAATAAHRAGVWGRLTGARRAEVLRAIAAKVRDSKAALANYETQDMGKPIDEAEWDMDDVAGCFDFYAGLAEALDGQQDEAIDVGMAEFAVRVRREPLGVVGLITPWNYPLLMATWKVAPALAAGNCCVLKPSELASVTCLELAGLAAKAGLPPGVLNVVTGLGPDAGAPLSAHPGLAKVAFTGSSATGRRVAAAAVGNLRPATMELGGKSCLIIFDDAELDKAVEWVMFGAFWTNGQICSATSRVLIHESVAEPFYAKLASRAASIKIGDPLAPGCRMGPIVSAAQYERVRGYVQVGLDGGAKLLTGGRRPPACPSGFYLEPTVFVGVTPSMRIWKEEIFGPVLAVGTFRTEAEAVSLANDSEYGLAGAVISADAERCRRVAEALEVGIVWVGCSQPCFCQAPWGGNKNSGFGRELGRWGLDNFLSVKQVTTYVSADPWDWYSPPKSPSKL
ncbi:ALDH10A8 [Scenedesmus sp. PABB004]|nr:ALDH10A8 [Scenedesmus sp. PABB004]